MTLMNLHGLTDEQKLMRDSVLAICAKHLPWDRIRRMDEAREFPHDAYDALAEAGYLGLFYPEALGGMAGSHADLTVLLETLGYYYTGIAQAVTTTMIYAGMHVVKFAPTSCRRSRPARSSWPWR